MMKISVSNKLNIKEILLGLFCLSVFLLASFVVGFRDHSIGVDTEMYVIIFHEIGEGFYSRFEPGFILLTKGIYATGFGVSFYFLIICLIVLGGYLLFYIKLIDWRWGEGRNVEIVLILGLLMASSWFLTSATNGLRQGMALPFAYLSLFLFFQRKYGLAFVLIALSVGFHYSSFLLVPFYALVFFRRSWLYFVVILAACLYPFGFFELVVSVISNVLGLSIYDLIKNYGDDQGLWVGFQIEFFIYSLFWFFLFVIGGRLIRSRYIEKWKIVVGMYSILLMPYFSLGFGGFSNRFSLIAWFFLPASQAAFILWSKFDFGVKLIIGSMWFFVGVFYFSSFFL